MHGLRTCQGGRRGARRRGGARRADRPNVADRRWAGTRALEARARRTRSGGNVLRRRDTLAGAGRRPRCGAARAWQHSTSRARSTWLAPTTSPGPSSPSSSSAVPFAGPRLLPVGRSTARSTPRERGRCSAPSCGACARCSREPPRSRDEPVPPPARRQPGRLVPVGRRGVRAGQRTRTDRSCSRSATAPATGAT